MRDPFDRPGPCPVPSGKYPWWEEALALLNRDLAATLPDQEPLQLVALSLGNVEGPDVYIAMADGQWHGNCLLPQTANEPALALESIAEAAQETVTERLWQAWPVCDVHGLGMHPRDADGRLSWWCAGVRTRPGTAHILAAVGALGTVVRISRPIR